jgi:hypothetical protein
MDTIDYTKTEDTVNFKDLQPDDKEQVVSLPFADFKELFKWDVMNLQEAIVLTLAVRQFVENTHSQNHLFIKDGNKKHQWLNHKIYDLLKINSIYTIKAASEKRLSELQEKAKLDFGVTASEPIATDTTGERRFHVVD